MNLQKKKQDSFSNKRQLFTVNIRKKNTKEFLQQRQLNFMEKWGNNDFKEWFSEKQLDPQGFKVLETIIPNTCPQVMKEFYNKFTHIISLNPFCCKSISVLAVYEGRIKQTNQALFCLIVDHFYENFSPDPEVADVFLKYTIISIQNLMIHPQHPLYTVLDKCDQLFAKWWNQQIQISAQLVSQYLAEALSFQRKSIVKNITYILNHILSSECICSHAMFIVYQIFTKQKYMQIRQVLLMNFEILDKLIKNISFDMQIVLGIFSYQRVLKRLIKQGTLPIIFDSILPMFEQTFQNQEFIIEWVEKCSKRVENFADLLIEHSVLFQRIVNQCSKRISYFFLFLMWHPSLPKYDLLVNKYECFQKMLDALLDNPHFIQDLTILLYRIYQASQNDKEYLEYIKVDYLQKMIQTAENYPNSCNSSQVDTISELIERITKKKSD